MNAEGWYQRVVELVSGNAVLERLVFVSVELAVLAAAVAIFIRFARVRSPRVRGLLWLVVLAKPILGLMFGTPIAVLQLGGHTPAVAAASGADSFGLLLTRHTGARYSALEETPNAVTSERSEGTPAREASSSLGNPVPAAAPSRSGWPAGGMLTGCWLAGVFGFSFLTVRDRLRLRHLLRSAAPPPAGLGARFAALVEEMGMRSKPCLRITAALDSPALVGFVRPVILLPAWLVEKADGDRLEWLLRHELTHCKLHDSLGLLVRRLAEMLFFFHPAVWWAGRKWEEAMELACDRALLATESDARRYAQELYQVLETRPAWRRPPVPADLFATRTQIGRRIEALLADPLRAPRRLTPLSMTGIAALAVLAFCVGLGFTQPTAGKPAPASTMAGADRLAGSAAEAEAVDPSTAPATAEELAWFPQLADPSLREKAKRQLRELGKLKIALSAWFIDEWTLPETLEQLLEPVAYLDRVPEDLFAPGRPIAYVLNARKDAAVISSVGPDGDDDGGRTEAKGLKRSVPNADIALRVSIAELRADLHPASTPAELEKDPIYRELLALKEREGRDNALIHYVIAGTLIPTYPNSEQDTLIRKVRKQGWDETAEGLLPYIAGFEPVFEEIRKGVALDYARNVPVHGLETPIPNYLAPQVSAKMLCIQGAYFESQGEYRQALEDFLTALTMGRDCGAPGALLIGSLISIAIQSIALDYVQQLARSGVLERQDLTALLDRLETIEKTQGSLWDTLRIEERVLDLALEMARDQPDKAEELFGDDLRRIGASIADVTQEAERIRREHGEMWDLELRYARTPYWKRDLEAYAREEERMKAEFHPAAGFFMFNFQEADERHLAFRAKLHEARLAAALAAYRADRGRFPERLGELVPTFLREEPVDPFSGEGFQYRPSGDGKRYALYSVGPDRKDNGGTVAYDPSNGTISEGDIVAR